MSGIHAFEKSATHPIYLFPEGKIIREKAINRGHLSCFINIYVVNALWSRILIPMKCQFLFCATEMNSFRHRVSDLQWIHCTSRRIVWYIHTYIKRLHIEAGRLWHEKILTEASHIRARKAGLTCYCSLFLLSIKRNHESHKMPVEIVMR